MRWEEKGNCWHGLYAMRFKGLGNKWPIAGYGWKKVLTRLLADENFHLKIDATVGGWCDNSELHLSSGSTRHWFRVGLATFQMTHQISKSMANVLCTDALSA